MKTVIKNAKLANDEIVDIFIKNDLIEKVMPCNKNNKYKNYYELDAQQNYVFPGMIDMHVHMRDLNQSHKETFYTGSIACARNGITTFCDMPNSNPTTTSMKNLNLKLMMIKQSIVDYHCYIGLNKDSTYKEVKSMLKNAIGIKIFMDNSTGDMKFDLSKLDQKIFELQTLFLFHAEDENILEIKKLFKNRDTRIHICHISSKKEYEYVKELQKEYTNITYEFSPHHLILNNKIFKDEKLSNVKPSLKSKIDQEFLLTKFLEDENAIFATDHAPHLISEKKQRITYGFPEVDTALYILIKMVEKKMMSFQQLVKVFSTNPAKALKLTNLGEIKKGYKANLIIVNPNYKFTVKNDKIYSKAKWTPYEGINLYGEVLRTFVNGKEV